MRIFSTFIYSMDIKLQFFLQAERLKIRQLEDKIKEMEINMVSVSIRRPKYFEEMKE